MLASDFVLSDQCELVMEEQDITIFIGPDQVERAVFRVDEETDPLPHCDPNVYGYALVKVDFIDRNEGVAVCEVVHINSWLTYAKEFGVEVMQDL